VEDLFEFFPDPAVSESVMKGIGIDYSSLAEPHEIAALLLQFLYQLPEPVITYDMHDSFVSAMSKYHPCRFRGFSLFLFFSFSLFLFFVLVLWFSRFLFLSFSFFVLFSLVLIIFLSLFIGFC